MAAERIFHLVCSGARYRDFGVVLCGEGELTEQLRMVFAGLQIPCYATGRSAIGRRPISVLVLSALEAVSFGCSALLTASL